MIFRLLVILLIVTQQRLNAQPPPGLPPDSMLPLIARSHLLLQAYTMRAQAYRLRAHSALAWTPPIVGAGTFMIPWSARRIYNDIALGSRIILAEQEIPHPAKLQSGYQYLAFQENMMLTARTIALHQLHYAARQLYIRQVAARQKAAALQRQERLLLFVHQVAQARLPYRQAQVADVSTAAARLTAVRNDILTQKSLAASYGTRLSSLLSLPGLSTADSSYAPIFTPGNTDTVSLARANKAVYQLEETIQWKYLQQKALRQERWPNFKVGFYQFFPVSPLVPNSFHFTVGVRIPLAPWAAGYHQRKAQAIAADIAALDRQRSALLQQTHIRLTMQEHDIHISQQRIYGITNKILPALQQALEADMARYQENRLDLLTILRSLEAVITMEVMLCDYRQQLYEMIITYDHQLYR